MSLNRVAVSIPFADPATDPEAFVPVFHEWIRRSAVEGLLVDVATYAHVHHGPGVMLIGHEGDYSIDLAEGRPALRYTLKRDAPAEPAELVARAARRLSQAAGEAGRPVAQDRVRVQVLDRLSAPNTPETLAALGDAIRDGLSDGLGRTAGEVTAVADDPRAPFTVEVALE